MTYQETYKRFLEIKQRLENSDAWFEKNKDIPEDSPVFQKAHTLMLDLLKEANELYNLLY